MGNRSRSYPPSTASGRFHLCLRMAPRAPIDARYGGEFPSGVVTRWTTYRLCVGRKRGEPDRGNEVPMDRTAKPITPDGQRARWPTWSPDGSGSRITWKLPSGAIWVADLADAAAVKLFDSGLTRTLLDWSPNGKEIAFIRGAGKEVGIDALDVKSGTVRRVLGGELGPGEPRWSPDGKSLLFSTHSPTGIAMLNVSDLAVTAVIK